MGKVIGKKMAARIAEEVMDDPLLKLMYANKLDPVEKAIVSAVNASAAKHYAILRSDLALAIETLKDVIPLLSRLLRSDFLTDKDFDRARLVAMEAKTFLMHMTNKSNGDANDTQPTSD